MRFALYLSAGVGCATLLWISLYVAKISDHLAEIAYQLKGSKINKGGGS